MMRELSTLLYFRCSVCNEEFMIRPQNRGKPFNCPGCSTTITASLSTALQRKGFNHLYKWLGIAPQEQPPNHYRLLGINIFEDDMDVIANAGDARMAYVKNFQTTEHSDSSQTIMNQIAEARVCLLNPIKKTEYDQALKQVEAFSEKSLPWSPSIHIIEFREVRLTIPPIPPPLPKNAITAPPPQNFFPSQATKTCPYCAETILFQARKCKHCGEYFQVLR